MSTSSSQNENVHLGLYISPVYFALLCPKRVFPADAEKIEKEGVDQKELGRRVSYDEPNELAFKRRSTIQEMMLDLGIELDPVVAEEEEENAALIKKIDVVSVASCSGK